MLTLLIDTATDHVVVALADGATVRDARSEPARAQALPAIVEALLVANGLRPRDLDRIAVGIGPGAFTGLRIGVAFARGLAAALELELTPISTIATVARTALDAAPADAVDVRAAVDARRGEWFVADARAAAGAIDVPYATMSTAELDELGEPVIVRRGAPTPAALAALAVAAASLPADHVLPDYGREPDAVPGAFAGAPG